MLLMTIMPTMSNCNKSLSSLLFCLVREFNNLVYITSLKAEKFHTVSFMHKRLYISAETTDLLGRYSLNSSERHRHT